MQPLSEKMVDIPVDFSTPMLRDEGKGGGESALLKPPSLPPLQSYTPPCRDVRGALGRGVGGGGVEETFNCPP